MQYADDGLRAFCGAKLRLLLVSRTFLFSHFSLRLLSPCTCALKGVNVSSHLEPSERADMQAHMTLVDNVFNSAEVSGVW